MYKLQGLNCAMSAKILVYTNNVKLTMTAFSIIIILAAAGILFPYRHYFYYMFSGSRAVTLFSVSRKNYML